MKAVVQNPSTRYATLDITRVKKPHGKKSMSKKLIKANPKKNSRGNKMIKLIIEKIKHDGNCTVHFTKSDLSILEKI